MIRFRPHHFMCTLGFEGRGYSSVFIRNYQEITDQLNKDPHSLIQVVKKNDDVCMACPHQIGSSSCTKQVFIDALDKKHQEILRLKENQIVSWKSAKEIIKTRMTLQKFHVACNGCGWKVYGICERALNKLLGPSTQSGKFFRVF